MKDKQFRNLIEHTYPAQKQAMYEDLKKALNLPDDDLATAARKKATPKPAGKWRNFFKQPARLAACVSAAVAVACLAIILPFTLKGGSGPQTATTNPSATPEDRFCKAAACKEIKLNQTLKDYSELNNLSLLYVDWYDKAEVRTSLHVDKEDQTDIVFYEEIMMHKSRGSIVELYITDWHTKVDKVEDYKKRCKYVYVTTLPSLKIAVRWGCVKTENGEHYECTASFIYVNYIYTLVLRYPIYKEDIFELIDSMLPKLNIQ